VHPPPEVNHKQKWYLFPIVPCNFVHHVLQGWAQQHNKKKTPAQRTTKAHLEDHTESGTPLRAESGKSSPDMGARAKQRLLEKKQIYLFRRESAAFGRGKFVRWRFESVGGLIECLHVLTPDNLNFHLKYHLDLMPLLPSVCSDLPGCNLRHIFYERKNQCEIPATTKRKKLNERVKDEITNFLFSPKPHFLFTILLFSLFVSTFLPSSPMQHCFPMPHFSSFAHGLAEDIVSAR
jgi:hypothetical protein